MNIGDVVVVIDSEYEKETDMYIGKYGIVVDLHEDSVEVQLYAEIVPYQQKVTERFKESDLDKIGEQTIWRDSF